MQQKQRYAKLLVLLLVVAVILCGGVLMTRDIPPTRHAVEKQLDAKVILGQQ